MSKDRTYTTERKGFDDGIERAAIGVFVRLSRNQVEALEQHAGSTPLGDYIASVVEATIQQMIPARAGSTPG